MVKNAGFAKYMQDKVLKKPKMQDNPAKSGIQTVGKYDIWYVECIYRE